MLSRADNGGLGSPDVGVAACEGVVCADDVGESSYSRKNMNINQQTLAIDTMSAGIGVTDPHEAHGAPREYPIRIHHLPLPSRACAPTTARRTRSTSCGGTFDIIIESFDDVPGDCFFQVGAFVAVDFVFELGLWRWL